MMRIILVFLGIKGEQRSVLQVKSLGHLFRRVPYTSFERQFEDGFGWPSHCWGRGAKWLQRLSCCHGNCMERGTIIQPWPMPVEMTQRRSTLWVKQSGCHHCIEWVRCSQLDRVHEKRTTILEVLKMSRDTEPRVPSLEVWIRSV